MIKDFYFKSILLSLFLVSSLWAQNIPFTASVNKTSVGFGEPITLTLEFRGASRQEPELRVLERDFTILSRKLSSSSSLMNGRLELKTAWALELVAKRPDKTLTIPPIKMGPQTSSPITISQSAEKAAQQSEGIEVIVSTDKKTAYVQSEIILRITIKTSLPLRSGSLSKPEIADAIMEPLVEEDHSEVIENGIKYQVFSRSYAVFPSKIGSLSIPPVVFNGMVASSRARGAWAGFFATGSKVVAQSAPQSVTIMDVPKDFPKNHPFLPVKSLALVESYDQPEPQFFVNRATTRRFLVKAKGTLASLLPEITKPMLNNLQVYVEQGKKSNKAADDGMEASLELAHVYMPSAPGALSIPAQTIYWWDTEADALRSTPLRALELTVGGEAPSNPVLVAPKKEQNAVEPSLSPEGPGSLLWPVLALLFSLLWIFTVIIIYALRKSKIKKAKGPRQEAVALHDQIKKLIVLCKGSDAKAVYHAAQALIIALKRDGLSECLNDDFYKLFAELETSLYAETTRDASKELLAKLGAETSRLNLKKPPIVLTPLYPL